MSIQPREPSGHARKAAEAVAGHLKLHRHGYDEPAVHDAMLAAVAELVDRLAVSPAVEEALKYLRALTPGGSEYQTAEECATYARLVRDEQFAAVKSFKAARDAERERADKLAEALERIASMPSRTPSKSRAQQLAHEAADIARAALAHGGK